MIRHFLLQRLDEPPYMAAETTHSRKAKFVPVWTFRSWDELEGFFLKIGATPEELRTVEQTIQPTGIAHLVIENAITAAN
jgi:hypothetical protein